MSYAISVMAVEAGLGQRDVNEEEDSWGILVEVLSIGLRDTLGRFERGKVVSGIEVRGGLTTGVNISPGEKPGEVLDDIIAAIRLHVRLVSCLS